MLCIIIFSFTFILIHYDDYRIPHCLHCLFELYPCFLSIQSHTICYNIKCPFVVSIFYDYSITSFGLISYCTILYPQHYLPSSLNIFWSLIYRLFSDLMIFSENYLQLIQQELGVTTAKNHAQKVTFTNQCRPPSPKGFDNLFKPSPPF